MLAHYAKSELPRTVTVMGDILRFKLSVVKNRRSGSACTTVLYVKSPACPIQKP